jgi:hypothetical protein
VWVWGWCGLWNGLDIFVDLGRGCWCRFGGGDTVTSRGGIKREGGGRGFMGLGVVRVGGFLFDPLPSSFVNRNF